MFDHVSIRVKDFQKSRSFYEQALEPLGWVVKSGGDTWAGFGQDRGRVWLVAEEQPVTTGMHLAFESPDRTAVDAFHAAAMKAGGRDNGKPGIRPDYGANYYGAFVYDPDGNNIEAVCYKEK